MVGISIDIGFPVAAVLALLGAAMIYRDARARAMDTADMWAVGFAVGFFLLPVIGGLVVLAFYVGKRPPRRPRPYGIPPE
ncbi:hypothetical protein ACFO5R_03305 [Halosolutus amylolyticus]|uniref:Uncharacterized protein n=1 Tax=Halosolutus amylolyticus TaxID=2932267 RepID=A0ABD5PKA8_9EURY|nr:hypothetical protein [Halosolutus amylolyticus]